MYDITKTWYTETLPDTKWSEQPLSLSLGYQSFRFILASHLVSLIITELDILKKTSHLFTNKRALTFFLLVLRLAYPDV